jgi:hypothetical protein
MERERERRTDSIPIVFKFSRLIVNISSYSFHKTFAQIYPFFLGLDCRLRTHFMVHFYTLRSCLLESCNIVRHDFDSLFEFLSIINEDCSSSLFYPTSSCVSGCLFASLTSKTIRSDRTRKVCPVWEI